MEKYNRYLNYKRIHFIGIGGVSMSALAKFCVCQNKLVSGSDKVISGETEKLKRLGIKLYLGHHASAVKYAELVVYSSAISENNEELLQAKKYNIPCVRRSEFLGEILSYYKNSIAVSGCHGKTTCTAMISQIFIEAGESPTVFLGGERMGYGNFRNGKRKVVVAEACEYKKNFLELPHTVSVVLNIDKDHLDSYDGMEDMVGCFSKFVGKTLAVINNDDINAKTMANQTTVTFGIKNPSTFMAKNVRKGKSGYSFDFYKSNVKVGKVKLSVVGKFNVMNALASLSVADLLGIDFFTAKRALESFTGVKRRSELLGKFNNMVCYGDYAHHPKELQATAVALNGFNEKTLVVFQPHTYSRTKYLFNDFIAVLKKTKKLIIYKTYPAREEFDYLGSGENLALALQNEKVNCEYVNDENQLYEKIEQLSKEYSRAIFFGAGDIYDIAVSIIKSQNKKL